jgi:hypothetical protein
VRESLSEKAGVAIGEQRLLAFDDERVTFPWKD